MKGETNTNFKKDHGWPQKKACRGESKGFTFLKDSKTAFENTVCPLGPACPPDCAPGTVAGWARQVWGSRQPSLQLLPTHSLRGVSYSDLRLKVLSCLVLSDLRD